MATKNVAISELFDPVRGKGKYTRAYGEAHPGKYPVYSASLSAPLCFIDTFDFDGTYLSWTTNGYGGRVRILSGRFSINGDRGVLKPKTKVPPLPYLQHVLEPKLIEAAVGRTVEGKKNEYTKVGPEVVEETTISLPITAAGLLDHAKIDDAAKKLVKIEALQRALKRSYEEVSEKEVFIEPPIGSVPLSLGDKKYFSLSIGDRIVLKDSLTAGVPMYSANVFRPLAFMEKSNLISFDQPSILWAIDNTNFDWNFVPAGIEFGTTDHCGRLQIKDAQIDAEYVYHYLQATRLQYGFDRVFRSSLENIRSQVTVLVPTDEAGNFDLAAQNLLAERYRKMSLLKKQALTALEQFARAKPNLAM